LLYGFGLSGKTEEEQFKRVEVRSAKGRGNLDFGLGKDGAMRYRNALCRQKLSRAVIQRKRREEQQMYDQISREFREKHSKRLQKLNKQLEWFE